MDWNISWSLAQQLFTKTPVVWTTELFALISFPVMEIIISYLFDLVNSSTSPPSSTRPQYPYQIYCGISFRVILGIFTILLPTFLVVYPHANIWAFSGKSIYLTGFCAASVFYCANWYSIWFQLYTILEGNMISLNVRECSFADCSLPTTAYLL